MSDLLAIVFSTEEKTRQLGGELLSMEKENLITMEDAVVAVKKADGAIELNQLANSGEFWGIRAAASGYPAPIVAGALTDFGTNDRFVKDIGKAMPLGGAAVLVLVSKLPTAKALERLKGFGGTVLCTPFDKSAVETIHAALPLQR